jgi:hypothetical protein
MHVNACLAAATTLANREPLEHEVVITSICRRLDRMPECHDAIIKSACSRP